MLKFWKARGRRESSVNAGLSSSSSSTLQNHTVLTCNGGDFFITNLAAQVKELESLIKEDELEVRSSHLSKTLAEIINDNEAFTYFIQYLETIGQGAMINFLLDVENFSSALSEYQSNSRTKLNQCDNSTRPETNLSDIFVCEKSGTKFLSSKTNDSQKIVFLNCDKGVSDNGCDERISTGDSNQQKKNDVKEEEEEDLEENKLLSRLLDSAKNSESSADALKIFNKYFSHKAPLKININTDIRKKLIENLNSNINKDSFSKVKEHILEIIEKEHFNDYLRSEYHCQYQIYVLTSKKVCLSDILFNETALFYFMEFLEQEGCNNFLEFWISALNFQQQYEEQGKSYNLIQAQSDAMVLYDKYFSLQATNPLHLGDDVRIKVEESICKEDGPLPNCFEYPRRLIAKILEINYFQAFLQSQLFFKYLSELISTIQTNSLLGGTPRSKHPVDSDGSSDVSISTTNTLLAAEDSNPHRKLYKHLHSSSLSIDTQQLYDPDSLWQRGSKRPGLNFGRINALGRFETDLEPEPDRKEESRITKAVKKLVNMSEDKSKEEMAWQVAAMIVRDVTNITMPSSTTDS